MNPEVTKYIEIIKGLDQMSQYLNEKILYIIGASILLVIGSDYLRPASKKARLIYLVLLPSWIALAVAFYFGDSVKRWYVSATTAKAELVRDMLLEANYAFAHQREAFMCGMLCLGIWLVLYLIWWVFQSKKNSTG